MRKIKLFLLLLLSFTIISFKNVDVTIIEGNNNKTSHVSVTLEPILIGASMEAIVLANSNEEVKDFEQLKEELELYVEELKVVLEIVKVDSGKPVEDVPFWHQFAPEEYINNLRNLVQTAEELLENEEATNEDLDDIHNQLKTAEVELENNITTGTKESDYTNLIIIIGSSLSVLFIIGIVTIFILSKKRK